MIFNYLKKIVIITLLLFNTIYSQDGIKTEPDSSEGFFSRKTASIVILSGVYASTLYDSYIMWWKDDSHPFGFYKSKPGRGWLNDPGSLGIDKIGHFYTSYFFYHAQKNLLLWGGFSNSFAVWFSAGLSAGLALLIEVGDGFSSYQFDYQDLIFNLGGLGFGLLQDIDPFFQNFQFKWSFIPPGGYEFPPRFTEHYEGHIYWLSFNIHNLFNSTIGDFWPDFLQPAIGFSISNDKLRREFIFGLDFNLSNIFHTENKDLQLLIKTADMLHLPAPGIKFSHSVKPEYKLLLLN